MFHRYIKVQTRDLTRGRVVVGLLNSATAMVVEPSGAIILTWHVVNNIHQRR